MPRLTFNNVRERVRKAPGRWALERSIPVREGDRYQLWSNNPHNMGTTYCYGTMNEVVVAVDTIEKHGRPAY